MTLESRLIGNGKTRAKRILYNLKDLKTIREINKSSNSYNNTLKEFRLIPGGEKATSRLIKRALITRVKY
jgi:hypothetical protein